MGYSFQSLKYTLEEKKPQKKLVKKLAELNLKVATAESCTGGLLSKMITDVPGSSKVFEYGFCTYSNAAKIKILGVSKKVLQEYSAVSKEAAFEMALGAKKISEADLVISVTGYAGSIKEREYNNDVGLIYIGIIFKNKSYILNLDFRNNCSLNRKMMRKLSVKHAISASLEILNCCSDL